MSISPFVTSNQDPRQAATQLRRAPTATAIAAPTAAAIAAPTTIAAPTAAPTANTAPQSS